MAENEDIDLFGFAKPQRKPRSKPPEGFILSRRCDETADEFKRRYSCEYHRFFRKVDPARFAQYAKKSAVRTRALPGYQEKHAARAKARYSRNKEHCAAVARAWRERNAERHKANGKAWRANNRERNRLTNKAWEENNKERKTANARRWASANNAKMRAASKRWAEKHPDAAKAKKIAYRKRARGVPGKVTASDIQVLMVVQKGRCAICKAKLSEDRTIDHILPLKLGGTHDRKNLQLCCRSCNSQKGAKHPLEHARERGMLL